jgi:uncharacterized protein YyaL (SSP411 family)
MAASNLLRLYHYTQNKSYLDKAIRIMKAGSRSAAENPFGFGQMLNSIYLYVTKPIEITVVVTGSRNNNNSISSLVSWLNRQFLPHSITSVVDPSELARLQDYPFFKGREAKGGQETAFVCKNFTCSLPIQSTEELERQLTP